MEPNRPSDDERNLSAAGEAGCEERRDIESILKRFRPVSRDAEITELLARSLNSSQAIRQTGMAQQSWRSHLPTGHNWTALAGSWLFGIVMGGAAMWGMTGGSFDSGSPAMSALAHEEKSPPFVLPVPSEAVLALTDEPEFSVRNPAPILLTGRPSPGNQGRQWQLAVADEIQNLSQLQAVGPLTVGALHGRFLSRQGPDSPSDFRTIDRIAPKAEDQSPIADPLPVAPQRSMTREEILKDLLEESPGFVL